MHFHFLTAFPEMILPVLESSMLRRAIKTGIIKASVYDLRDFTDDPHRKIDDRPYGGGPGMVLKPEPILKAHAKAIGRKKDVLTILLSPRGKQFDGAMAEKFSKKYRHIVFICGHYEGIDARVAKILKPLEISVGPYTLTGGEVPALLITDSVSRHIKGVLGNPESIEESRNASEENYTRPAELTHKKKTYAVPEVLRTGNHAEIEQWRKSH